MQSFDDSQIFTNEDLSKAENRVNVALFGLMPQDWFREVVSGKARPAAGFHTISPDE